MPATSAGMTGGFFQFGHSERPALGYYRGRYVAVEDQARRGDPRAGDTKAIGAAAAESKAALDRGHYAERSGAGRQSDWIAYPPEEATTGRRLEGWLNSERGPLAAVPPRNSDARCTHSIKCANEDRLTLGSVFGSRLRRLNTNAIRSSCVQTGAART